MVTALLRLELSLGRNEDTPLARRDFWCVTLRVAALLKSCAKFTDSIRRNLGKRHCIRAVTRDDIQNARDAIATALPDVPRDDLHWHPRATSSAEPSIN